ncbi:MAG TPA: hypothetical protein VK427_21930 [Kofleriaceae bacterium]|nr:hypothetical protein [Kofleriaceae bacterium]
MPSRLPALLTLAVVGCSSPAVTARRSGAVVHETPELAAVIVRVWAPWYAPRFMIRRGFAKALGEYESIAAIRAKYFSISDDRAYGGLYLWSSREAADRHFTPAWHAKVRDRRGVEPDVQTFAAPFVIDGAVVPRGDERGNRSLAYPGSATWARWRVSPGNTSVAAVIAAALAREPGLVRAFVVVDDGSVGAIALWASRDAADRATTSAHLRAIDPRLEQASVVRFETPLLIDATLRDAADRAGVEAP